MKVKLLEAGCAYVGTIDTDTRYIASIDVANDSVYFFYGAAPRADQRPFCVSQRGFATWARKRRNKLEVIC